MFPAAFAQVNRRTGSPVFASATQSLIALIVVGAFAVAGADPVLKLFTWLTNLGSLGVLLLMATVSFAVIAYFRAHPEYEVGLYRSTIAPLISGVALVAVLVLGIANFNVLITSSTTAPEDSVSIILPIVLFVAAALGMIVAAVIRARDPERYRRIGERTEVERAEHLA